MRERATEDTIPLLPASGTAPTARFARPSAEFATSRTTPVAGGTTPASPGTAPATGGTTTLTLIRGGAEPAEKESPDDHHDHYRAHVADWAGRSRRGRPEHDPADVEALRSQGHPGRAPGPGPPAPAGPRRLPRTPPGRRGHPPRFTLGDAAGRQGRPRPEDAPGGLGRSARPVLRPHPALGPHEPAVHRSRHRRPDPRACRRRQDPPGDRSGPHRDPPPQDRGVLPGRQALHPAARRPPGQHPRGRGPPHHQRRRPHHRRLRTLGIGRHPDQRLLRDRRRTPPASEHDLGLQPRALGMAGHDTS